METYRVPNLKTLALTLTIAAIAPAAICQDVTTDKVYLEADTLIDDTENNQMIAEGEVIARYEGRRLYADKVIYNLTSKKVRAIGNVRIIDPDGTVRYADEIEVDDSLGDGVATEFSAQLPQDAIVVARAANRLANGSNSLDRAIYTACEICEENNYTPTWSLRARKAVQNAETQMITYEDAVFELKGVPVLYLPYFAHPDPSTDRRSGLLPPTPKVSSKLGFVYQQPYYWAISKSQDLTITPNIHTNVNPSVSLDYRKQFYSGQVQAYTSFAYDYLFDSNGDRQFLDSNGNIVEDPEDFTGELVPSDRSLRSHIFANGDFAINEDWQWGFSARRTSDDTYLRRYDISNQGEDTGIYDILGQRLLSQLYVIRQSENAYFDAAMLSIQSLRENEDDGEFAVATPIAFGEKVFDLGRNGLVSLQGVGLVLNRDIGDDTRRLTTAVQWENFFVAPAGLILEPVAKVRADYYDYSFEETSTSEQTDDAETRTSALVATTVRWPFMRRGKHADVTFEPIATLAYGEASVENGRLPNEDATNFEYTMATAFDADPFGNSDLIETGARIAAGFRMNADFRNNIRLNGAFARRWKDENDPALEIGTNLDGTTSDFLISGGVEFSDLFYLNANARVDENYELQRIEARVGFEFGPLQASATYFDLSRDIVFAGANPDGQEGIQWNATYKMTKNVNLLFSQIRNIETGEDARRAIGVQLYDDCSFIRLTYEERDIQDRGVGSDSTLKITFGLRTLGRVDDDTFD